MEPVITIPMSDYNALIAFRDQNQFKIEFHYYKSSFGEGTFKSQYDYFSDSKNVSPEFRSQMQSLLSDVECVITRANQAANLLQMEREQQKRVPAWIVRLFNRKAN